MFDGLIHRSVVRESVTKYVLSDQFVLFGRVGVAEDDLVTLARPRSFTTGSQACAGSARQDHLNKIHHVHEDGGVSCGRRHHNPLLVAIALQRSFNTSNQRICLVTCGPRWFLCLCGGVCPGPGCPRN